MAKSNSTAQESERDAEEVQGIVDDIMDLPAADRALMLAMAEALFRTQQKEARRWVH
ncbi:MAG: hypothetical protein ACHP7M_07150 [Burkholderiales bacterium]